jgi:GDPmannose 4,6-dehydratase
MRVEWRGAGVEEIGIDSASDRVVVKVDPRYFRPTEVDTLLGDPTKARLKLSWQAETSFADLVKEMVADDLAAAERDSLIAREGYKTFSHHE